MSRPLSLYKHKKGEDPGANIWTPIPGFYGVYEIDYHGHVRRTRGKGKHTITPITKRGVAVVRLVLNGHRNEYRVSSLMAKTFLAPPTKPGMVLYHPNGVKKDNVVGNLEWITKKELGKRTGADSRRKPVLKLNQQGEPVKCYSSARAAARDNFMSYQTVIDRCNGKCKSRLAPDGFQYEWDGEAD